jgi:hypothetical protein
LLNLLTSLTLVDWAPFAIFLGFLIHIIVLDNIDGLKAGDVEEVPLLELIELILIGVACELQILAYEGLKCFFALKHDIIIACNLGLSFVPLRSDSCDFHSKLSLDFELFFRI